jgi:hypothetical protein
MAGKHANASGDLNQWTNDVPHHAFRSIQRDDDIFVGSLHPEF